MPFETFIGWRYLFRRERGRQALGLFIVALGIVALAAIAFFRSTGAGAAGGASLAPVIGLLFGALLAMVCGLLLFFSVFTTVAVAGVMVGVSALIVVLAVTSGFQEEFKDKVLGVNAHVIVMKWGADFSEYRKIGTQLRADPEVVGVAPFVFSEMQAARGTTQTTVLMKAIDPKQSPQVLDVGSQIIEGSVAALDKGNGILLGRELARRLHAKVGDTVKLLSPLTSVDMLLGKKGEPSRSGDFRVAGIFYAGFDEYDKRLVYLNLSDGQRLMGWDDVVSGVEIKLKDAERARSFSHDIEKRLGGTPYRIIQWEELNRNLFTALRMQKVMISFFLTIIIFVAAFNIVASLTMIVLSKRKEIAILKSMGASSGAVARVFQVAGLTIGGAGVVLGIAFGLLICAVARRYGYPLDPKIYLISTLPVHVRLFEIVVTAGITLLICLLATIYPAFKASRLRPVEGLRYD